MSDEAEQDKETLRQSIQKLAKDPLQLRLVFCIVSLVLGWVAVLHPLGNRMAYARAARDEALALTEESEDVLHYVNQIATFAPHAVNTDDTVDWSDYIIEKLNRAGISFTKFDAQETEVQRSFKVVRFDLAADVATYAQIWDFVDRIEHGERLVRIEDITMVSAEEAITLRCLIRGLVKSDELQGFPRHLLPVVHEPAPGSDAEAGADG